MENSLSHRVTNWREGRRFRAFELHQRGWKQKDIAEALGVSKGAVSQWVKRARGGGIESLRHRKSPGRSSTVDLGAKGTASPASGPRGPVLGVPGGLVDPASGGGSDPARVWRLL